MIKEVYSKSQYIERKRKLGKCKRIGGRI